MGLKGIAIGAFIGGRLGPLGAIVGAVIGHFVEKTVTGAGASESPSERPRSASARPRRYASSSADARKRAAVFCTAAAAMLAKMAKADGHVSAEEIAAVERAFVRLGFSADNRRMAIAAFRRAKDDDHSIYEYANEFASVIRSLEVRELFYEMLWDLACADGRVTAAEDEILRNITVYLGVPPSWYAVYARERLGARRNGRRREAPPPPPKDTLAEAYETLGVSASASDEEVRRAYREKAKKCHPDTLRAQGLPDEMIGRATEQMARVNGAWGEVKAARGL